jgi:hypothetical protein
MRSNAGALPSPRQAVKQPSRRQELATTKKIRRDPLESNQIAIELEHFFLLGTKYNFRFDKVDAAVSTDAGWQW